MKKGITGHFNAFKADREDGALIGPWNPWLHEPVIGKAIWDLTLALTAEAVLPDNVLQVVILTVGAHFNAAYEDLCAYRHRRDWGLDARAALEPRITHQACRPDARRKCRL